jgi:hypothetical protein
MHYLFDARKRTDAVPDALSQSFDIWSGCRLPVASAICTQRTLTFGGIRTTCEAGNPKIMLNPGKVIH